MPTRDDSGTSCYNPQLNYPLAVGLIVAPCQWFGRADFRQADDVSNGDAVSSHESPPSTTLPPGKAIKRKSRRRSAVDARSRAQQIAFAPIIFYATVVMRDSGLLAHLERAPEGLTMGELSSHSGLSEYAVSVLMELALDVEIVLRRGDRLELGDLGYFLLNDSMTRVNTDFVRDVCYQALPFLQESLLEGRPAGLHTLGQWPTVYEGLAHLEEPARSSWFRFDHYYSDTVFDNLLPVIFERPVRRLLDIGANTGKWALKCLAFNQEVQMVMVDHPGQLNIAREALQARGLDHRATLHPMNVLDENQPFPEQCDVIWMSQFLDCFGPEEIVSILSRLRKQMDPDTRLFILEPFSDQQQFVAGSLSLNATSLYFSCVANGNSRMYSYQEFRPLIEKAGLSIRVERHLSFGHSLVECRLDASVASG